MEYETRMYLDVASWTWLEDQVLEPLRGAGFAVRPDRSRACLRSTSPVFEGNLSLVLDGAVSGFTGTWALPRLLKLVPPTETRPCTQVVLCVTLAGRRRTSQLVLGCLRDPPPASALPDTFEAFGNTGLWFDAIVAAGRRRPSPGTRSISRNCVAEAGAVSVGHSHPRREMIA